MNGQHWSKTLILCLLLTRSATSAPPEHAVPRFDLADCLAVAEERQPSLTAFRESLRVAQIKLEAVEQLRTPGMVLNRDLPVRKKQARFGVSIAEAGLKQESFETVYDVTRTYFSVIYARMQLRLVRDVIKNLRDYRGRVEQAMKKAKLPFGELTPDLITMNIRQAQAKELEALKGEKLAIAALREAMGVDDDFCFEVIEQTLPRPKFELCQEQIVAIALQEHGEMIEALAAADAFGLEVDAQRRMCGPSAKRTLAASTDIHMQEVPLGEHNGTYRPGAVALEMPVTMFGLKSKRIAWAEALSGRADAVAFKTRGLIRLDAINAYLTWEERCKVLTLRADQARLGDRISKTVSDKFEGNVQEAIEYVLTNGVLAARAKSRYNEALYLYVLALADLERVTAGGFQAGLSCPVGKPQP